MFCRDRHFTPTFSNPSQKDLFKKESEIWGKVVSSKIIVTLVTQGLLSSLISSLALLRKFTNVTNV